MPPASSKAYCRHQQSCQLAAAQASTFSMVQEGDDALLLLQGNCITDYFLMSTKFLLGDIRVHLASSRTDDKGGRWGHSAQSWGGLFRVSGATGTCHRHCLALAPAALLQERCSAQGSGCKALTMPADTLTLGLT